LSKKNRETEKHHEGLVFWWCFSFAEKEYFFSFYLTKAEVADLIWQDINLEEQYLTVRRSVR